MDEYILGITSQDAKLTNIVATKCFVRILSEENEYKNGANSQNP